jgi:CheY-like chemotaxis protein
MSEKKSLLVIDDEEDFCILIKEALEDQGNYCVDYLTDPTRAEAKIAEIHPDLILLDNVMPKRQGSAVVAALKKNPETKNIPLIMVSGRGEMVYIKKKNTFKWMPNSEIVQQRGDISDERSASALSEIYGVNQYVSKPVSVDTLLSVIQDVLD